MTDPVAPPFSPEQAAEAAAKAQAAAQEAAALAAQKKADAEALALARAEEKRLAKEAKDAEKAANKLKREEAKAAADAEKAAAKEAKAAEREAAKALKAVKPPKVERVRQNGVIMRVPGTKCGDAWDLFDRISREIQGPPTIGQIMADPAAALQNAGNIRAEYAAWRRFYGIAAVKRPKAVEVKPEPAPAELPADEATAPEYAPPAEEEFAAE